MKKREGKINKRVILFIDLFIILTAIALYGADKLSGNMISNDPLIKSLLKSFGNGLVIANNLVDDNAQILAFIFVAVLCIWGILSFLKKPKSQGYLLELVAVGSKPIHIVKIIKDETGVELRDAKNMVDNAPCVIARGKTKEEAQSIKSKIEEVGGFVNIRRA